MYIPILAPPPFLIKLLLGVFVFGLILLYIVASDAIRRRLPSGGFAVGNYFGANNGNGYRSASSTNTDWLHLKTAQDAARNPAYFVFESGCHMPSFPVFNDNIRKVFWHKETAATMEPSPIECPTALTHSDSRGTIWVAHNRTALRKLFGIRSPGTLNCTLVPIERRSDKTNVLRHDAAVRLAYGELVRMQANYVRAVCAFERVNATTSARKRVTLEEYHYFVFVPPAQLVRRNNTPTGSRSDDNRRKINVLVVGLDSVSRLNFHRQMPRAAQILQQRRPDVVELFGYNKVEDNTFPNLIPALSGLDTGELKASCQNRQPNATFDECQFIWDLYREQGYVTAFAEDMAVLGLFNYFRPGFRQQPTDFRLRPVVLEMEKHVGSAHMFNTFLCLGSQRPVDIVLDYLRKFVESAVDVARRPYFGFFWTTSYTHDKLNYVQLVDDAVADLLDDIIEAPSTTQTGGVDDGNTAAWNDDRRSKSRHHYEDTFLLLMSDHGLRWGSFRNTYQGMMEERQPFLFLIPPRWFADRFPEAYVNLMVNRGRLTTHFDLYETMRDLLDADAALAAETIAERTAELHAMDPMPRGISLFLPVPPERTCAQAGISPHWCTCHEKQTIATTNARVQAAARFIVRHINGMVKPFGKCQTLSLHSIADATIGSSNVDIVGKSLANRTAEHFADVTVRLRTKPGLAEFEATVRVHDVGGRLNLTGPISRTNLYGRQSECVDDASIKLYCFCDSFM